MFDLLAQLVMGSRLGTLYTQTLSSTSIAASGVSNNAISVVSGSYALVVFRMTFGGLSPDIFTLFLDQTGGVTGHTVTLSEDIIDEGIPLWAYVTGREPLTVQFRNGNATLAYPYKSTIWGINVPTVEQFLKVQGIVGKIAGIQAGVLSGESTAQGLERKAEELRRVPIPTLRSGIPNGSVSDSALELLRLHTPVGGDEVEPGTEVDV